MEIELSKLADVFNPVDIEWRVQNSGIKNDKPWAMVLAYVTNRAIMDRLDDVCGPENWSNEFREGPGGGVICGISVKCGAEWVCKWDGADKTQIEAVKGGLSGAMKRAGVQWGIGRYLYNLDATFAKCDLNTNKYPNKAKDKSGTWFSWQTPTLPKWAVPKAVLGEHPDPASTPEVPPEQIVSTEGIPVSEAWMGHEWKDEKQRKLFIGLVSAIIPVEDHPEFEKFLLLAMNSAIIAEGREPKMKISQGFITHCLKPDNMNSFFNEFVKE